MNYLIYLESSPLTLSTTVISASRWNQNAADVPGKVRQLDSEWLDLRNPSTTADWLGSSGEVFVQKSQLGGGSPVIRGFEASRVLLMVDGVRMNSAIFRAGHLQNIITVDNMILDRVEILYGPSSTMYGSDALGGVVNLFTKQPQLYKSNLVSNKAPTASAGEDIISKKNRKIELVGTGTDEDGSIVLYEWDFNGDGTLESSENADMRSFNMVRR